MDEALEHLIWQRAESRCEYCQLPNVVSRVPFEVHHIIARKHGGKSIASNLALSCFFCNNFKGPNIAGADPKTRRLAPLFHPRRHKWSRHFAWDGPTLVRRAPVGRVTIAVLAINNPAAIALRASLIEEGRFPPV